MNRFFSSSKVGLFLAIVGFPAQAITRIEVKLEGLVCSYCANAINKRVAKHQNIESVNISLEKGTVTFLGKPNVKLSSEEAKLVIEEAGFKPGNLNLQEL